MTKPTVYFEDFPVGFTEESPELEVSREEMFAYARVNDPWDAAHATLSTWTAIVAVHVERVGPPALPL